MRLPVSRFVRWLAPLAFLSSSLLCAQSIDRIKEIIDAARADSPRLKDLLGHGLPEMHGRDGAIVWGQEFLFAVESASPATVAIDYQPAIPMRNVPGTNYWYKLAVLRLGTTHNYNYFADGKSLGAYDVAGYNPDSYPEPGVPRGKLSEMKTLRSKIYPGMSANYWVYVNPGADTVRGAPLMVWQDGETIVGTQDLVRLRLQIVSDNLVAKKVIPPMVHVLISPGSGGEATGTRRRSIQYDTVSNRYGQYLLEEILPEVEKTYKIRRDAYSRAIAGASSGAICALDAAWYFPDQFSRVLSHIGSYVALQWHPEQNLEGGYIVSFKVRREPKKNIRVWLSDGQNDQEAPFGSWPLNNLQLANALKLRGYDFHFRFGTGMHAIAQGALDLPESLAWLWRDYDPSKSEQTYTMEESERAKPLFRVSVTNRDAW
jgi:enterochelin esterase-like enzyme